MGILSSEANRLNLVPAIIKIESQMKKIEREYRLKLEPYEKSLVELRKINTACEMCGGTGKVLHTRACAEDDRPDPNDPRDYNVCERCMGTGLAHPKYPVPAVKG